MRRSWLVAGLTATGYAAVFLALSAILAHGLPHGRDVVLAGGLYTLAFAARMSI